MLPKENRLDKRKFRLVLGHGRMIQAPDFGLIGLRVKNDTAPQVGIIVSTKISRSAVVRNRVKRTLREALRVIIPSVAKGFLFVILTKKSIIGKRKEEVEKPIFDSLGKLGALE